MPNALQNRDAAPEDDRPMETVVSVIYVTAEKTFSGEAVYVTADMPDSTPYRSLPADPDFPGAIIPRPTQTEEEEASTTVPRTSSKPRSSTTLATTTLAASLPAISGTLESSDLLTSSLPASAAAAASTENAQPSSASSEGMSGGAKAGLALGILIAIGAVLALVLLFYRRKKQQDKSQKLEDEKFDMGPALAAPPPPPAKNTAASIRTARTASTAPRLSLRPVTEFLPNLAGDGRSASNKPEMAVAPASASSADANGFLAPMAAAAGGSAWERPGAHNHPNDPANPFGNHAETVELRNVHGPAEMLASTTPAKPEIISPVSPLEPENSVPFSAVAVPAHGAQNPLSGQQNGAGPAEMPNPAPVQPTELPATPIPSPPVLTAIPTSPVPPPSAANTVHRVQLDFKPNMDDELDLRAGQLVRLLHEYDDGWALCQRMDRSQQGVAPRTCLSKHAVKPRPASPAQGRPRGASPQLRGPPRSPLPLSPPNGRNSPGPFARQAGPVPPSGGRNPPSPFAGQPRPASPAGGRGRSQSNAAYPGALRSMSPGPYGAGQGPSRPQPSRRRSNSASGVTGRGMPPPGLSPMNPAAAGAVPLRKPVPGQAI
ncbi:hypothetical protein H2201_008286 [Coniosporium apollinis]|uniref:SH3 domain-containing protein n=1 Tax=Coniosporium apollinis TaxID=61459 RepID=A0ABQ9NK50_9PEZI|nr:hypothetical protein H2201_008286 [Coniosporium apollinis]